MIRVLMSAGSFKTAMVAVAGPKITLQMAIQTAVRTKTTMIALTAFVRFFGSGNTFGRKASSRPS
jgi:hypothetical protein